MSLKNAGAILWVLVLLVVGVWIFTNIQRSADPGPAAEMRPDHDGRAFVDIAWKRLPHIPPFELTEKSGEVFDSRSLAGKPYVLSFFFTNCPTICRDLNRQIARLGLESTGESDGSAVCCAAHVAANPIVTTVIIVRFRDA